MRQAFLAGVAALSLSAAVSNAQTSSTVQSSAPAASAPTVTVTGCVERADQLVQSSANTLGTAVGSQDFALIKAAISGSGDKAPVGTAGSDAPKGPSAIRDIYLLDGKDEMLNPHVGHEVEIVGVRVPSPHVETSTTVPARAPVLRVQSVKMIAESCSR